jgi:hypothetical protein
MARPHTTLRVAIGGSSSDQPCFVPLNEIGRDNLHGHGITKAPLERLRLLIWRQGRLALAVTQHGRLNGNQPALHLTTLKPRQKPGVQLIRSRLATRMRTDYIPHRSRASCRSTAWRSSIFADRRMRIPCQGSMHASLQCRPVYVVSPLIRAGANCRSNAWP